MSRILLCDARGPVDDLLDKMGGEEGEVWVGRLKSMLRGENPWEVPIDAALFWEVVYERLDLAKEYSDFIQALGYEYRAGYWLIPVIKGVTCNKIIAQLMRAKSPVYLFNNNLDEVIPHNARSAWNLGNYAVEVKATMEADEINSNKSAETFLPLKRGITILERLLLGWAYYLTFHQHLDVHTRTICAGSRVRGDTVPAVFWDSERTRVRVDWMQSSASALDSRVRLIRRIPIKTAE